MNDRERHETLGAIKLYGDPRWITNSGAFLDLLREFVRAGKIEVVPEACEMYFSEFKGARESVLSALPALLTSHDKTLHAAVGFSVFYRWSELNPGWVDRIQDRASSPQLVSVRQQIRTSVSKFESEIHLLN